METNNPQSHLNLNMNNSRHLLMVRLLMIFLFLLFVFWVFFFFVLFYIIQVLDNGMNYFNNRKRGGMLKI